MNYSKSVYAIAAAAAIAMVSAQVQAATPLMAGINVNVTLTSSCTVVAPNAVAFAYIAGSAPTASTGGTGGTVTCSEGLPYTMFMDKSNGATDQQAETASVYYLDGTYNLGYTLTLNSPPLVGTGVAQSYTLSGSMGNQWSRCRSDICYLTNSRVIYVNF